MEFMDGHQPSFSTKQGLNDFGDFFINYLGTC